MEALRIGETTGDKDDVASSVIDIGNIYVKQKNYAEALVYANRGLQVAKEVGSLVYIQGCNELLTKIYENSGDKMKALAYYKAFIAVRDSLSNQENTKKVVRSEMNFDFEKKQEAIKADQDKKDALQKEQAFKQQLILYFISAILLLVFGIAIFAYRSYLQKQRANKELDEKNHKIEGAYTIIEDKNREITDSINYAKRIQNAMLPSREEIKRALPQSFVFFKPKDIVSGDFYFFKNAGERLYIAAADCTGHGVPGAFMSLIGSEKLNDAGENNNDTGEILKALNKGIKASLHQSGDGESTRDGMDIALCKITGTSVQFSGANRPLWIIRKDKNEIEEVKATKKAIGGFTEEDAKFESSRVDLHKGDTFYIFSDGYADQFGGDDGKKLTTKRFRELVLSLQNKSMQEQEQELGVFIEAWKRDKEQLDDILVIGVRV